jgi:hypothetical protein
MSPFWAQITHADKNLVLFYLVGNLVLLIRDLRIFSGINSRTINCALPLQASHHR